jgi:4'-phosphopantetheinyl transferase
MPPRATLPRLPRRVPLSDLVDVWRIDLRGDVDSDERLAVLSADERSRAARFVTDSARRAFIMARSAMRAILSQYVAATPLALRLSSTRRGKPFLVGCENVSFNLSHSHDLAALAVVTTSRRIGVDIEKLGPVPEGVTAQAFSPAETRRIETAANPAASFFAHWTMKEAYLKANGDGLHVPLTSVRVAPGAPQRIGDLVVSEFDFCNGFAAAIAIDNVCAASIPSVNIRDWTAASALNPAAS